MFCEHFQSDENQHNANALLQVIEFGYRMTSEKK